MGINEINKEPSGSTSTIENQKSAKISLTTPSVDKSNSDVSANPKKTEHFNAASSQPNTVELLNEGKEAYPAMLQAIAGAESTVLMESYIFNNDLAGHLFAEALCERATAGIEVCLIVDGIGTLAVPSEFFESMQKSGVRFLVYRPVGHLTQGLKLLRRNHRKLLVVDGIVGFVGGLNIGDEWLPVSMDGAGWHDIHVKIEGPAVRELAKLSLNTWRIHGNEELDTRVFLPPVASVEDKSVVVVGSGERRKRRVIRRSYLRAIKDSKDYVYIANAYFIPGLGYRRAMRNAVKRGVDVRVMVPANGDIWIVQKASEALFGSLLRCGVKIYKWQGPMLHAKTAVIDDSWSTVGSFNLDTRSWAMNLEVNVNVRLKSFTHQLREMFEQDQHQCIQVTLEKWQQRSWLSRLTARFFFKFRKYF